MKEKDLIKKMLSGDATKDDVIRYLEESLIEEKGVSKEEARYFIRVFTNPEFCKKETGHTPHEVYLIGQGFTSEQARYIEENPCIDGPREECDFYRENKECFGCTNVNGFFYWKAEPDEKLKPVKEVWRELSKKSVAFVFINKLKVDGNEH